MSENGKGWPPRPETWPDNMDETETALYLRIDAKHTPASAKRALRHLRRGHSLPCMGRICGQVLFNRASVDRWIVERERGDTLITNLCVGSQSPSESPVTESWVPLGSQKIEQGT